MDANYKDLYDAIKQESAEVHANVNQYYDDKPYSFHLDMVSKNTIDLMKSFYPKESEDQELMLSVYFGARFHDSIEDARLTYNDVHKIASKYMSEPYATQATEIVYALTNEKGRSRAERANDKYYEGIRNTPYANIVKLADRTANMEYSREHKSSMYSKYLAENEHFLESIGVVWDKTLNKYPNGDSNHRIYKS